MKLGVTFPQNIIGGSPAIVRDFAQTAEGLGYAHLALRDGSSAGLGRSGLQAARS